MRMTNSVGYWLVAHLTTFLTHPLVTKCEMRVFLTHLQALDYPQSFQLHYGALATLKYNSIICGYGGGHLYRSGQIQLIPMHLIIGWQSLRPLSREHNRRAIPPW